MDAESAPIREPGTLTMPDVLWDRTKSVSAVIGPLAARTVVGRAAVDAAAAALGVSRRQVYVLIRRHRGGSGLLTDLAPSRSSGGKGTVRLSEEVEDLVRVMVRKQFLTRQRRTLAVVYRDIAAACRARQLPVPARNTVERRIRALNPVEVGRRRGGPDAVRPLQSAGDEVPVVGTILERVQIDHTVIDVVVVDERERRPIGRPYLTVAIDVYSRCIIGMVVTLEAPSAVSVGLCLAHAGTDKRPWLEGLGIDAGWPMSGKPRLLYLDNASEFKSEALRRGCDQHGIELAYRPLGRPHYGGIVERLIGTAMKQIHELPGTTFSNPSERGRYDSDREAALTLRELEKWMALAVTSYHGTMHSMLGQTPAGRWAEGAAVTGRPPVATNPTAFLVDFLPVVRRTLTRTGFVIDHVHYFSNALKPWISRRETLGPFLIRRDPRDISRIWVLEPEGAHYVEVPYRTMANPSVSLWEHRHALARLHERGVAQVDEAALFRTIGQMREIARTASKTTKRMRRDAERRNAVTPRRAGTPAPLLPPEATAEQASDTVADAARVPLFDQIEQW
ncbi:MULTISPECIES: Mu transposase C-terminal domain-containing protein [Micrococcaceae]|uniref:Mu transposase C-terminal domain-containing protein n=1 Tax=Micrococcaceae TaxID=1268 RepID=UPI0010E9E10B|nr:transposase [Arthrobacter sp. AET 35A]NOJ63406.1 transposase [Arthrobacter sp. 147(2020)]TNB69722.1 DDE-type integrase/transposase/recombinase [Arthrobacter sp. BB-1]VII97874.1 TniA putative transposase [Arthrobacter sp. DR-2P]